MGKRVKPRTKHPEKVANKKVSRAEKANGNRQKAKSEAGTEPKPKVVVSCKTTAAAKRGPQLSTSERLILARTKRAGATALTQLDNIRRLLQGIVDDAEEGTEEWIDAGTFLATLLLQDTRANHDTTISRLLDNRGFSYRLSQVALTQSHAIKENPPLTSANAWDNVLPDSLLHKLSTAFHPSSSFWNLHNYSDGSSGKPPSPYFSYIVPLDTAENTHENDTVVMQIIRILQKQAAVSFPGVMDCKAAEWWTHCRPHSSGHQLHFDSDDEGRGGVRNPVASTVLYLSTTAVGGETLVTTQTSTGNTLATKGWLCASERNRLLAFRGNLLHGVVPGVGASELHKSAKRVTFMVAFWKQIKVQDEPGPGSARPFSRVADQKWAKGLLETVSTPSPTETKGMAEDCFFQVPVWEDVDKELNENRKVSLQDMETRKVLPPYDSFFQFYI